MAIPDKSSILKGRVFIRNRTTGTAGLIGVGNTTNWTLEHSESEITQTDYTESGGADRNVQRKVDSVSLSLTLTDFNRANLEIALRGGVSDVTGTTVSDESLTVPATLDVETLIKTAGPIDTSATVTVTTDPAGTTYVAGTDYEVVNLGIVILPTGSISASDALLVSYTSASVGRVEALVGAQDEYEIVLAGINEAQADAPFTIECYRVKVSLPSSIALIGDEFATLPIEGRLLADSAITANDESKFYRLNVD